MSLVEISSSVTLHREARETPKCDHKEHGLVTEISVQGNQGTKSLTFSKFMGSFFSLLQQKINICLFLFSGFFRGYRWIIPVSFCLQQRSPDTFF